MLVDDFADLVDKAIALNKANRKCGPSSAMFSPIAYAKQMCTVKLDIGRAVGKSTYIADHATAKDIIIVPTLRHKSMMYLYYKDKNVVAYTEILGYRTSKPPYVNIYVDEIAGIDLDFIYNTFVDSTIAQTFIILGA